MTREFLWMLLLSPRFDAYITSLPGRANIPKLNRKELGAFEFALPSFQSQEKFSRIIEKVGITKELFRAQEVLSKDLFGSISQKAFAGEL